MTIQTFSDASTYEQALLSIARTLPAESVLQVLQFARFLQTQALDEFALDEDESPEEIAADEVVWDAQFAASQDGLAKMAEKVRAEISAGKSKPMIFTADGRIKSG
ncbi:MAG: hypothetical protein KF753_24430 [Caldilineaceae bacterium]|nr:hypothetical protein [Caldilineaceae bacterium]